MNLRAIFEPKATLSEAEIESGLRWLTWEGAASIGFFSITTSGILVAFALDLGADNFTIGVLAAIPFLLQTVQIPAIWLVEKFRRRKVITITSWVIAQLCWFPVALIPFFLPVPSHLAVAFLLGIMVFRGIFSAVTNAAWNGWQRDLIPQTILGRFFSRRLVFATVSAVVFSVGASLFIDLYRNHVPPDRAVFGFTLVIIFGAVFLGLASPLFMTFVPEPLMQSIPDHQPSMTERLLKPLKDVNFRRLLQFLFYWSFASNLAIPFFAVHMLQKIGLPVSAVIGFSVLSQLFNILFLRVWGNLADRFGNKSVLSVGISLYLLIIFGWVFTTMPDRYFLTIPLLFVLQIFAGIASAAVTITVGTIGLKLAPREEATSYLASASLFSNFGAGLGPLVGGFLANYFSTRQLDLTFTFIEPVSTYQFSPLIISGRDFLFIIAFFIGLLTLGLLALIHEEGESGRDVILESLLSPMREISRPMSSVPGFTFLSNFPFGFIKRIRVPGLDVAFGVTVYQLAETARLAASAAVSGRRVTRRLGDELSRAMRGMKKPKRTVREYGVEVSRHMARGAMHVIDDKPIDLKQLARRVMEDVVTTSIEAGIRAQDAILGASQGIIQGASETGTDVSVATSVAIDATEAIANRLGIFEKEAVNTAAEGALQAAEALGPETAAEVVDGIGGNLPEMPEEKTE